MVFLVCCLEYAFPYLLPYLLFDFGAFYNFNPKWLSKANKEKVPLRRGLGEDSTLFE